MEESIEQSDQPPPASVRVHGDVSVDYNWLEEHVVAALNFLGKEKSTISVQVVDDATMTALHAKHSGIEETTDVLTFDSGSTEQSINAEIAVCSAVAQREVQARGHPLKEELLLYILHGMLHCCGFDDRNDASYEKMHAEEDRILTSIGVGRIWSVDS